MAGSRNIKYVRRDCINAAEHFLSKVNDGLPYAAAHIEGIYYSNRNAFKDSTEKEKRSKGDKGARLGIVLGGGDRDVTSYMFHMRDLSDPANAKAKSLRYVPDGGKPAVLSARSFPDGTIGQAEQLDTSRLVRATARMMNSVSFDAMFQGWGDNILAGTEEERAVQRVAEAGESGGWDAVEAKLSGPDPMDAMTAWGYIGVLTQGEDPDSPVMADLAYRAMGLDALYGALEDASGRIAADPDFQPDLADYLDPGTDDGRRALRGLACLSAYKEIRDHGGIDVKDDAGRRVIGVDMDDPRSAQVYDRLANTRAMAELYQAGLSRAEGARSGIVPAACVQSTFAGIAKETGKAPDVRVDNSLLYRFYRCAMLGEDPDMPSGAPEMTLSTAAHVEDLASLSPNDILISSKDLPPEADGMPFAAAATKAMADPGGAYGRLFSKFPAMDYYMSLPGGSHKLEQMAVSRLQGSGGKPVDGLALEAEIFANDKTKLCNLRKGGASAGEMARQYVANFVDAHEKSPQLLRCLDASVGVPDFSRGTSKFGECAMLDLKGPGGLIYPGSASGEGGNNPARTARAFRKADAEREAARGLFERETGLLPGSMQEIGRRMAGSGAMGAFNHFMDVCGYVGRTDKIAAAMMQNDFIVLSDCYHIKSGSGLAALSQDVQAMYAGEAPEAGQFLYRPRSRAEASALGAIYDNRGPDWKDACVPDNFQGSRDGFLQAAWRGAAGNPERLALGAAKLEAAALDLDTLDDARYSDLIAALNGPQKSVKMMELDRAQRSGGNPERQDQPGKDIQDGLGLVP